MKTRILILLMTLILSGGISQAESAYSKLVEPGRTWWYWSWMSAEGGSEKVILGLTIDRPDSEGWSPCYALDSLNQKVVDVPLCHLREENRRVEIRPNLHLPVIDYGDMTNEQNILHIFLGWWDGNELDLLKRMGVDANWNKNDQKEFLLYDFNYKEGDSYRWPWSGIEMDFGEKQTPFLSDSIIIDWIGNTTIHVSFDKTKEIRVFRIVQSSKEDGILNESRCFITEGLGITRGNPESYVLGVITWYGFFIAPISMSMEALSGSFSSPTIPFLQSVVEADGTYLYYDPKYDNQSGILESLWQKSLSEQNLPIFDLFGRRVSNPTPGSVYIRGGKKYIVR